VAVDWLKASSIKASDTVTIRLEKPQRYQLLKLIFKSTKFSLDFKNELLRNEKQINYSDFDELEQLGC